MTTLVMSESDQVPPELLLSFMLEDVNSAIESNSNSVTQLQRDSQYAQALFRNEVEQGLRLYYDRRIGTSMEEACTRDELAIGVSVAEERQARRDYETARAMDGGLSQHPTRLMQEQMRFPDEPIVRALEEIHHGALAQNFDQVQSLTWTLQEIESAYDRTRASKDTKDEDHSPAAKTIECVACSEVRPVFWSLISACGHAYCSSCVAKLFKDCTKDEQLFPPRCCRQPMNLEQGKTHLLGPMQILFDQKALEYTTPNRTYCCNSDCSTFVPPNNCTGDWAVCPKCRIATCTICKNDAHHGECPQDTAAQKLREIAAAEGWQQCSNCNRMVSISHGCNHMTCLCKAEFCYNCGNKWHTCSCPRWEEARLLAEANTRAARADPGGRVNQVAVQQAAQRLQETHECDHNEAWEKHNTRRGPGRDCENCGDHLPHFHYQCQDCDFIACAGCRFNIL